MSLTIVMIGPNPKSKGGIASVIAAYFNAGLSNQWPIVFLPTHVEGGRLAKLRCALSALVRFAALLIRRKAGLLHVHVARRNSFWRKAVFMQLAFWARCPVLIHLHSGGFPAFYENECGPVRRFLIRHCLKHAEALIVLTKSWQAAYQVFAPKRIVVVPNFVELSPLNQEPTQPTLVFLGRLTQEKGVFDLFEAIARVKGRYPDLLVRMGGEGNLDEIAPVLARLGIADNIRLEGWVDGARKHALLSQATAFVLPSYVEGLPMGVMEAMACGLAVIATRVGGIPDMVEHDVNGILVSPGRPEELAAQIERLISDAALRHRLAMAGRRTIEAHYSAEAVLPLLGSLYRESGILPLAT